MSIRKSAIEFTLVFVVTLVIVTVVTFLWNLIGHGIKIINWETSFRFTIIFGILLTWVNHRKPRGNGSGSPIRDVISFHNCVSVLHDFAGYYSVVTVVT
jgi:hypothetical protein